MGANKAIAGSGGVGLSGALVTLGIYFWGHDLPAEVVGALTTVVSAILVFPAVYFTPKGTQG